MKLLLRRLRGLLGLGALGGAFGALFGLGVWLIEGSGPFGLFPAGVFAQVFGLMGAATAGGFGLLLSSTSSRRRLEDISLRRVALLGAAAGASIPILVGTVLSGTLPPVGIAIAWAVGGGITWAGAAAGLVAVAKRADAADEQLSAAAPREALGP